jgi:hypothetical protein
MARIGVEQVTLTTKLGRFENAVLHHARSSVHDSKCPGANSEQFWASMRLVLLDGSEDCCNGEASRLAYKDDGEMQLQQWRTCFSCLLNNSGCW